MKNILLVFCVLTVTTSFAGNPDRQGEAGAYELLMNPWGRSSGLHGINASFISGVEAMQVNVAGLSRINSFEAVLGHARWLVPSGLTLNAGGIASKVGKNGTFGLTLMSVNFGKIPITTTLSPEGTGGEFSPNFFNIGLGYAHSFGEKISVGITGRVISESIQDVSAFGFGLDAGVQYTTGPKNNFKFGISLKNIGSPMKFGGEGLGTQLTNNTGTPLTYNVRPQGFELPSLLHIGLSYDFYFSDEMIKLTPVGNFTSNSFGRDELGVGAELAFKDMISLRAAWKYDIGTDFGKAESEVYTGPAFGASFNIPLKKGGTTKLGLDYAYRVTSPFDGTHNMGLRLSF